MRFALEHQNPLVAGPVTGTGPFPGTSYSLVTVPDPATLLFSLKPAEEGVGRGLVARLWNLAEAPASPAIAFSAGPAATALFLTHIETDAGPAPVAPDGSIPVDLAPHQMRTVLARLATSTPVESPEITVVKAGPVVVVQWTSTGQACYTALRGASPALGGGQLLFQGSALQAGDTTNTPLGSVTYYTVE
jgi:hypothetical protein